MDRKHLLNLELDKIVAMAIERAVCPEAKTRMQVEIPLTEPSHVRYLLGQTDVIAKILLTNGTPRISSCFEADMAVLRAVKGGILSMAELLNVATALYNFNTLNNWFADRIDETTQNSTQMDDLFFSITPQPHLHKSITEAILSDTEMADTASDELYTLRRKIRSEENAIRDKLDAVVKNPGNANHLQEALVSIRNGRYVVPVKSEARSEIPGVIHDVSQTGGTLFVEPAAVVEQNAKIMQLKSAEQAEMDRILSEFSANVADIAPLFEASWDAMLEIDIRIAKAALGLSMRAICPKVNDAQCFFLNKARHPLLNPDEAVPVDISLGEEYDTLIITGPNTGGKTVSLKTAGLLSAMAQMGYLIPAADDSSVCVFKDILVDIGDEQSIEQSLSTFSAHIKNITEILTCVNDKSLVLLDELGAGTDPAEGAALAVSIIEHLREAKALVMGTTHYAELKLFALDTKGVQNAGSEFDIETLRPTYRLIMGVPGRSNAFLIGERLGLSASVIEKAKGHLSSEQRRFEVVLSQLEDLKLEYQKQEEELKELRYAADNQLEIAKKKRDELIQQGQNELDAARRAAKALADDVQNTAYELVDEMKRLEKDKRVANAQKAQRARQIIRQDAKGLMQKAKDGEVSAPIEFIPLESVVVGQEVWVPELEKSATITKLPDKSGKAELRIGAIRAKYAVEDLSVMPKIDKAQPKYRKKGKGGQTTTQNSTPLNQRGAQSEINLLGKTVEEALFETDMFLDASIMNKMGTVYIIHGRGTGALRAAITQHLKGHKHVKNYRLGKYGEGEDGVTVVELK